MTLRDKRILIVEDEPIITLGLTDDVAALGAKVVAKAGAIASALDAIATTELDGAILDIQLGREMSFRVADALAARHIPFVFISGHAPGYAHALIVAANHAKIACIEKPFRGDTVRHALESMFTHAPDVNAPPETP